MKKGGLPPFSSLFPGLFFHFFAFFDSLKAGHTPGFFLYVENHSLGEWFKRSLMAIMMTKKLPLFRIRMRSANCIQKQREVDQ